MKLEGKVAIVTGGARGIGAAICRRYADEGARVVGRRPARWTRRTRWRGEIGRGAFAVAARRDQASSIDAMVETVVAEAGGIDILVNNAAIFDMAPLLEITEASCDQQFAVNVKGLLFTLQAVARADGRAGPRRQDHQLREPGRPARRGAGRGLLRLQGGGDQPDPIGRRSR